MRGRSGATAGDDDVSRNPASCCLSMRVGGTVTCVGASAGLVAVGPLDDLALNASERF